MNVRFVTALAMIFFGQLANAQYEPGAAISANRARAALIYNRLTGTKISIDSQVIKDMEALLAQGQDMAAARLATSQPGFYTHTVMLLGSRLSQRGGSLRAPVNDLSATVVGFAKDDLDARQLLTANFSYRFQQFTPLRADPFQDILSSNQHYQDATNQISLNPNFDVRTFLVQAPQQIANDAGTPVAHPDPAGILTSRSFMSDCADMGTNRRCYEKVVTLLTCNKLEEVADTSLPDDKVGRDVSRAPGGSPEAYQNTCKGCHSNMDAQRGAFAFYDFDRTQNRDSSRHGQVNNGGFDGTTRVAQKYNRTAEAQPQGAVVASDSWVNYAVTGDLAEKFGWRDAAGQRITTPIISSGLNAYGAMISRSEAFSACMTKSVFENICRRPATAAENTSVIKKIASDWEKAAVGNYKLRWLFERIATNQDCMGK